MSRHLLIVFFIGISLLFSTLSSASSTEKPYYLEFSTGLSMAASSGQSSDQGIYQRPTANPTLLSSKNDSSRYHVPLTLGGGYNFPLENAYSWSIGGDLSQLSASTKGQSDLAGNVYHYDYKTAIQRLSVTSRLYYTMKQWHYFAGLNLGMASINSGGYHSDYAGSDVYPSKTKDTVAYGLEAGAFYQLKSNLRIGANLGYEDNGKGELGVREKSQFGGPGDGSIEQTYQTLTLGLLVSYQF